jgi:Hemerythrin HHE cation binding domain
MSTKATTGIDDAIVSLIEDHAKVRKMFRMFEKLHEASADEECDMLAQQICAELTVHASIEEEIFYPAPLAVSRAIAETKKGNSTRAPR